MDRGTRNCIKTSLKLANSVMAITGIAILMYSLWMFIVCLRDYQKYPLPWFLWACIGTGIVFSFIASLGHTGADTRNELLLSSYILFMFLLILVESLVTADIWLNDDWDEDFPKDRTERFDDFVDYVDSNLNNFRCLGLLIAFSQVTSFLLAMVLRTMGRRQETLQNYEEEVNNSATLPFLSHQTQQYPPEPTYYAVGHHDPSQYYPAIPPSSYAPTLGYAADVLAGNEKASIVQGIPKPC